MLADALKVNQSLQNLRSVPRCNILHSSKGVQGTSVFCLMHKSYCSFGG